MPHMLFSRLILFVALLLFSHSSYAASTEWFRNEEASLRIISGGYTEENNEKILQLGLHFTMGHDWKIYWRTTGDGGLPVRLDWAGSENIGASTIGWPTPKRYLEYGTVQSFGYKDEVVLPLYVKVIDPSKPVKMVVKADFATCNEICLFFKKDFVLEIPTTHVDEASKELINQYAAKIPRATNQEGFVISDWKVKSEEKAGGTLVVTAASNGVLSHPDLLIEGPDFIRFPKPNMTVSTDKRMITFEIPYQINQEGKSIVGQPLVFTFSDGSTAVEKNVTITEIISDHGKIWGILLIAFIGGLILNIMPCVLPVLSIKLLSVIKHSGSQKLHIRASFLSSAAGIITSFLVLAAIVLVLKSIGMQVGWGFQFQNTSFLIIMALILSIFAANLWGWFEIQLPSWLGGKVGNSKVANEHTLKGHFFSGVLATMLATPCSAPFVGTAIGFAFSQGAGSMFLIFAMLGIGLAAPYLLFAAVPSLVQKLPKPGMWMVKVKHAMGWLLLATIAWIASVAIGQLGLLGGLVVMAAPVLVIALFWTRKKLPTIALLHSTWLLLAILVLGISAPQFFAPTPKVTSESSKWIPFNQYQIGQLVSEGKIVLVDVTADWCLTCKANKTLVLDRAEVVAKLNHPNIVLMMADWTVPNEDINNYLKSFNRYGIPFNAVYGSKAPNGIALPELLTKEKLFEALTQAGLKE